MKFILLLSLLSLQCCLRLGKCESILIIALPQCDTEVSASWERGEEILPGALAAVKEARNGSLPFNLTLIVATSGPVTRYDLPYSGNMLEVIANLTWQKRTSDIIGLTGFLHPNIPAVFSRFPLSTISLVHFNRAQHNPNVHYLTASMSILTDSILAFVKEIHTKKVGIITEMKETYYLEVSHQLITKASIPLNIQIVDKHCKSLSDIANRLYESNAHVILLSVGPSTAVPLVCEAYKRGLVWPKYAWILHSYRLEDLLQTFDSKAGCTLQKSLEGIFSFQLTNEYNRSKSARDNNYNNPYADLLYASVRALYSSVDDASFVHFSQESSPLQFNPENSKIYIYHNMNGKANFIGTYEGTSHILINVSEIMFTDYDLPVVNTISLPHYLIPLPILCFLSNTTFLILYITFRREPSVKSTSVSLSMLIFTGCYLLVGNSASHILHEIYRLDLCMLLVWLSGAGLSLPLILATLLVKMLRVYHIFTTFKILKQSTKCKDYALLVYTTLILSPHIILLILRTAINPSHRIDNFIEHPGFKELNQTCDSDYAHIWYMLTLAYIFLLSSAVIIVAIKSRKIRHTHFKDTKKVNLLIFLLLLIGPGTFIYWYAFYYISFSSSVIILNVGHMLIAFACQITLLAPKVWPSVQKKILILTVQL